MHQPFIIRAGKLVTVGQQGTIYDGMMRVANGRIVEIKPWTNDIFLDDVQVLDFSDYVLTPGLVDCHTHLLEYAPSSLHPVTPETHQLVGTYLLFQALASGITALGEQVCGHPQLDWTVDKYRELVASIPIDVQFSLSTISLGLNPLVHFTAVTGSQPVPKDSLLDEEILKKISWSSDYPGENIFINATPANFPEHLVPKAGEIIYSLEELKMISQFFHRQGKQIGAHVGGEAAIKMALEAGIDILHHAHGITEDLMGQARDQQVSIVATPLGGTHLVPNSPQEIVTMVTKGIKVAISTDAYLPPHQEATWLPFATQEVQGPETLMLLAQPAMQLLAELGWNENELLALITKHPAEVLGQGQLYGKLEEGMAANFLVSTGIPGLEITRVEDIKQVYFQGLRVVNRL